MDKTPWYVVDLMTGETLGRFASELEAVTNSSVKNCQSADIQYRPRKRKVVKKFPYNN